MATKLEKTLAAEATRFVNELSERVCVRTDCDEDEVRLRIIANKDLLRRNSVFYDSNRHMSLLLQLNRLKQKKERHEGAL